MPAPPLPKHRLEDELRAAVLARYRKAS